jgi:hypothetical protein
VKKALLNFPCRSFLPFLLSKWEGGDVKRANGKVSRLKSKRSLALLEMSITFEQEGPTSTSQ